MLHAEGMQGVYERQVSSMVLDAYHMVTCSKCSLSCILGFTAGAINIQYWFLLISLTFSFSDRIFLFFSFFVAQFIICGSHLFFAIFFFLGKNLFLWQKLFFVWNKLIYLTKTFFLTEYYFCDRNFFLWQTFFVT